MDRITNISTHAISHGKTTTIPTTKATTFLLLRSNTFSNRNKIMKLNRTSIIYYFHAT